MRMPTIGLFTVGIVLLAGCGRTGSERDVRQVAERFAAAVGARDGATACGLLTADARQALEADQQMSCSKAVVRLNVSPARVRRVEVYVTSAAASYSGGGTVFLDDTTHGWRISAAGCHPRRFDQPEDCEVSA